MGKFNVACKTADGNIKETDTCVIYVYFNDFIKKWFAMEKVQKSDWPSSNGFYSLSSKHYIEKGPIFKYMYIIYIYI